MEEEEAPQAKPVGRRRRRDQEPVQESASVPSEDGPKMSWGLAAAPASDESGSGPRFGRRQGGATSTPADGDGTSAVTNSGPVSAPNRDREDEEEPVIPLLEEVEEDEISAQVAAAPQAKPSQLPTTLDTEAKFYLPDAGLEGVNLTVLYDCLAPHDKIADADEEWDPELVLRQLKSDMQSEADKLNADDDRKAEDNLARPEAGGGVR